MKIFRYYKYFTAFLIFFTVLYSYFDDSSYFMFGLFIIMLINTIICAVIWAYFHLNELNNQNEYVFHHYLEFIDPIVIKAKSAEEAQNWLHKHYQKADSYYLHTIKN